MRCKACGHENSPGATYCEMCGTRIAQVTPVDKSRIKDQAARVAATVSLRSKTDTIIPAAIAPVVIIGVILLEVIGMAALLSTALDMIRENPDQLPSTEDLVERSGPALTITMIASIVMYIFLGVLFYFLVRRLNRHFEREAELRSAVLDLVKSSAQGTVAPQAVANEIYDLEYLDGESRRADQKRSPVMWGVVMAFPVIVGVAQLALIVGGHYSGSSASVASAINLPIGIFWIIASLYIIYVLGRTIYEHDSRWRRFASAARNAMTTLGFPAGPEFSVGRVKNRSFVVYLILTIVTLSLFMIYWLYVLVKDPNEHFESQWEFEDNIVAAVA